MSLIGISNLANNPVKMGQGIQRFSTPLVSHQEPLARYFKVSLIPGVHHKQRLSSSYRGADFVQDFNAYGMIN